MTDHYDQLAVEVDPSFASALKQRLDEQRERYTQAANSPKVVRRPTNSLPHSIEATVIDGRAAARNADQPTGIYRSTEEEPSMIELETSSRTDKPRQRPKRALLAALVAAAAFVAIVFVAIRKDDDPEGPADQPSTTVTVPPTTPPQALFGAADVQLEPGTYSVDEVDGVPTMPILVTVGDGWKTLDPRWAIGKGSGQGMTFSRPVRVMLDACHPGDGYYAGRVTTVEGLVAALSEQGGWIDVTTPSDISIDGHAGKAFQRTVPADLSDCSFGSFGEFTSWDGPFHSPYYHAGETAIIWVLDLDGTVIVVEARLDAGLPAEATAELTTMLDSIRIAG